MKLTSREKEAVKQSIEHWEKDIVEKFDSGLSIPPSEGTLFWSDGNPVKYDGDSCPLCTRYSNYLIAIQCSECPYVKYYNFSCDSFHGHWRRFVGTPTGENAMGMVNALQSILERKDEKFEQRLRNVIWLAIGVSVGYTSGLVVAAIIYNYSKN